MSRSVKNLFSSIWSQGPSRKGTGGVESRNVCQPGRGRPRSVAAIFCGGVLSSLELSGLRAPPAPPVSFSADTMGAAQSKVVTAGIGGSGGAIAPCISKWSRCISAAALRRRTARLIMSNMSARLTAKTRAPKATWPRPRTSSCGDSAGEDGVEGAAPAAARLNEQL